MFANVTLPATPLISTYERSPLVNCTGMYEPLPRAKTNNDKRYGFFYDRRGPRNDPKHTQTSSQKVRILNSQATATLCAGTQHGPKDKRERRRPTATERTCCVQQRWMVARCHTSYRIRWTTGQDLPVLPANPAPERYTT